MSVNFFTTACQEITKAALFGLCDDMAHAPAYLDILDDTKWIAIVKNNDRYEVTFTAIDNCIAIIGADGSMEKRCDGMLVYENKLIFVELKERDIKNSIWIGKGVEQLKNIIAHFKANHDITLYDSVKAYIANSRKPQFQSQQMLRMQQFKAETGVILEIKQEISLSL